MYRVGPSRRVVRFAELSVLLFNAFNYVVGGIGEVRPQIIGETWIGLH